MDGLFSIRPSCGSVDATSAYEFNSYATALDVARRVEDGEVCWLTDSVLGTEREAFPCV